jgi:uncharacterized protein
MFKEAAVKSSEGRLGRIFVLRLEDGDILPECINRFASENKIMLANVMLIGGIGGGQIVVGPRISDQLPPDPMLLPVDGSHEIVGLGLIALDEEGNPTMHMHAALGRSGNTMTGCIRPGVSTWLVGEAVIYEILGSNAKRLKDDKSGFSLLKVDL